MATGVLSSNTPTAMNTGDARDNQLYRCIVVKRYFVDDELNITQNAPNPQVLYDCAILGGFQEGQTISNCRLASWLGGQYNYAERVLRANQKPLNEIPLKEQDGDIVLVQYIQGQNMAPMIVGMGTQPKDGDATGATIEDGPRWVEQYNGVETKIDKEGNWSLVRKGGMLDAETNSFIPEESEANFTGSITLSGTKANITSGKNTVTLDQEADTITISNEDGGSIIITAGNIEITNRDNAKISLTGTNLEITGVDTTTVNSNNRIELNAGMVNVGTGAAFHSTIFENLKKAFENHIHMVPQAMAGQLPSQKPLVPLTPNVGSRSVSIKE